MDVINKEVLAPARSEGEPNTDEGKAHNHVPGPDIGDWVASLGNIEDDDPEESDEKGPNHGGREPTRALKLQRICLSDDRGWTVIFLLLADARLRHGGRLHERMGRWANGYSSSITTTLLSSTSFNTSNNLAQSARLCETMRSPLRSQTPMTAS